MEPCEPPRPVVHGDKASISERCSKGEKLEHTNTKTVENKSVHVSKGNDVSVRKCVCCSVCDAVPVAVSHFVWMSSVTCV